MPVIVCPHCNTRTDFLIEGSFADPLKPGWVRSVGTCKRCARTVWFEINAKNDQLFDYSPIMVESSPSQLPEKVGRAFEEALTCIVANAPNGAGLLCRRAIQEALEDLDAVKGDLPTQLDDLMSKGIITKDLKQWADHARIGGRIGAHGTGGKDWGDPNQIWLSREDAEVVVEFCKAFFEFVYVLPKKNLARRRATGVEDPNE